MHRMRIVCCLLFAVAVMRVVFPGEKSQWLDEAALTALKEWEDHINGTDLGTVSTVAVYPLENDGAGRLTDLLCNAMTRTPLKVILRGRRLEELLKEHNFIIKFSDLFKPDTLVRLGEILGVQGVVSGSIWEQKATLQGARVSVNLRLANIKTGHLVTGRLCKGTAGPQPPERDTSDRMAVALVDGDYRREPDPTSDTIRSFKAGEPLGPAIDSEDGWYRVKLNDTEEACVSQRQVVLLTGLQAVEAPEHVYALEENVGLRLAPDESAGVASTIADENVRVRVLLRSEEWLRVRTKEGDEGWAKGYLFASATPTKESFEPKVAFAIAEGSLRPKPGPEAIPIGILSPGDRVGRAVGFGKGWYTIELDDTRKGYVRDSLVQLFSKVTAPPDTEYVFALEDRSTLHAGPSTSTETVGRVKGTMTKARVLLRADDWLHVRLADGKEGWSRAELFTSEGPTEPLLPKIAPIIIVVVVIIALVLVMRAGARKEEAKAVQVEEEKAKAQEVRGLLQKDEALRNQIVRELTKAKTNLREAQSKAQNQGKAEAVQAVKQVVDSIDLLTADIENADYGNAAAFQKDELPASDLERLEEFEKTIHAKVDAITTQTRTADTTAAEGGDPTSSFSDLDRDLTDLRNRFQDRADFLKGIK